MTIRAIILSGGRSSRFGGVHKPGVEVRTDAGKLFGCVEVSDHGRIDVDEDRIETVEQASDRPVRGIADSFEACEKQPMRPCRAQELCLAPLVLPRDRAVRLPTHVDQFA